MNSEANYQQKRDRVAQEYKELLSSGQSVQLNKKVSNLFRARQAKSAKLDVRSFNGVVKVNESKLEAEVEGMATYRTIVDETLKYGLLPAVVPELATITAGGAVSGGGIEASSVYYGLVHDTVLAMDILLPSGHVVTATPKNSYKDLFYGMANSFGTLGYILKLTIKLVKAKPYMHLRHLRFSEFDELLNTIKTVTKSNMFDDERVDFIDGSGFEKNNLFLTLGTFVDEAPQASNYRYMGRYFESIQHKTEDYLTARDFIWRWDSDWFWCSKAFYMNHTFPRLIAGKWMLKSESYWKLLRFDQKYKVAEKLRNITGHSEPLEAVIQDVQIPIENASKFWDFFTKNIAIRPVWFCPTHSKTADKFPLYRLEPDKIYINFGFWDQVKANPADPHYYNKLIEAEVTKLGGKKGLYSEAFYKKDEFWQIYNGKAYNELKAKYDPKHKLKDLYQKCIERA